MTRFIGQEQVIDGYAGKRTTAYIVLNDDGRLISVYPFGFHYGVSPSDTCPPTSPDSRWTYEGAVSVYGGVSWAAHDLSTSS